MGGFKIDYFQGIDVAEFNFAPYVQQMKDRGIQMVMYLGPYQNTVKLQQAMAQQSFKPKVYLQDATIQDQGYIDQSGSLGEGSYVYSTTKLFDSNNAEMKLYRSWLNQVSPGADPNFYGVYAWSAARLFVQQATALGGGLTRESLVQSLKGVKDWTSNGLHSPQQRRGQGHDPVRPDRPAVGRPLQAGLQRCLPVRWPDQLRHRRLTRWTS